MLVDRVTVFVRAGNGGNGCMSFRREKYVPKGGPDGGDGGHGGDVVLVGDASIDNLFGLAQRPHLRAEKGEHGMGSNCHGKDGADLVVHVPLGTLVYRADSPGAGAAGTVAGELLADIKEPGQRFIAGHGGKGGLGNDRFKSPTNQAPRVSTPGEVGEELTLRLELKLIADVGLIGLPNAGKSTLLRAISRATPKVADYPFTTLSPNIGVAELPGERRLVMADIPGLIEGASQGAGLGHDFLRHIERTSVLVHVLEIAPSLTTSGGGGGGGSGAGSSSGADPVENYRSVRRELAQYSDSLGSKPKIIALNKVDVLLAEDREKVLKQVTRDLKAAIKSEGGQRDVPVILAISGATGEGAREFLEACWKLLDKSKPVWQPQTAP